MMTKLAFLTIYGKKTGIGIAAFATALLATGLSLFFAGGTARPTLIPAENLNASYAQSSILDFQKSSTFRALNNQFYTTTTGKNKLFDVKFDANGNISVLKRLAFPNNGTTTIFSAGSYVDWVSTNSYSFQIYFEQKKNEIDSMPASNAKDVFMNEYNFEYALTFGAIENLRIFIAGATLFPLSLFIGAAGIWLLIKAKDY